MRTFALGILTFTLLSPFAAADPKPDQSTIFDFGQSRSATSSTGPLLAAPDAAAQAATEKTIWDLHKADYQRSKPAERAALAKRLIEESRAVTASPVERFVLLREARDLAAAAGDYPLMERAVAELAGHFEIDPYESRFAALSLVARNATSPDTTRIAAEALAALADDAAWHERYTVAAQVNARADELARQANLSSLLARTQAQARAIVQLQRQADAAKLAAEKLRATPDDPAANLAVGAFLCFVRGDWERGLPRLAKSSDASLATLAKTDIAAPAKPEAKIELADGWWDAAEKLADTRGTTAKARIMGHASLLYRQALPDASSLSRQRIDKRIAMLASLPAALRPDVAPAGKLIAKALELVADDFVVDIYLNGRLVPAENRTLQNEIYGAQVERVEIELHEGDWIVFNIANNKLRWDGAHYFACAGVKDDDNNLAFASETQSGRWLACDDIRDIPRFIAERGYLADSKAQPISKPWDQGDARMREHVPNWNGQGVWGTSRSTWIKYVVKGD